MRRALSTRAAILLPMAAGAAIAAVLLSRRWWRRLAAEWHYCTVVVASTAAAQAHALAIRQLVEICFPDDVAGDEDARAALQRDALDVLAGFHDVEQCEWLLAFKENDVIGLAMVVPYHDSLYVASLCVVPAHRGRGVGAYLMRSASALAAERGSPALSGSVGGGSDLLVGYYRALGGDLQPGHAIAAAGAPVPVCRRLRAPSGFATSRGVLAPKRLADRAASHLTVTVN